MDILNQLQNSFGLSWELFTKLIGSLSIILILWLFNLLVARVINRRIEDVRIRYQWRKTASYLVLILGIALMWSLWLAETQPLVYLGLVSAGLAIALQGPLSNLTGWGLIVWRKPFAVGDRIQIGLNAGDVIDTGLFKFTLLEIGNWVDADQSTGRILQVPNGKIFTETVANYTAGFEYIWHELPVLVTFESDWEKTESILQNIVEGHTASVVKEAEERTRHATEKYVIYFSKLTPIVYVKVEASGILLTARYFCNPRQRRSIEHAIWKDILRAFDAQPDIEFAYPTQRFYFQENEAQRHTITQQAEKMERKW